MIIVVLCTVNSEITDSLVQLNSLLNKAPQWRKV